MFRIGGVVVNRKIIQVRIFQFFMDEIFSCLALDVEKVMTPDEKKKFFDAIGYEGEDTSKTSYPVEVSFENLN